jgi:hypothetical protein
MLEDPLGCAGVELCGEIDRLLANKYICVITELDAHAVGVVCSV